jgi:hypothetical protein
MNIYNIPEYFAISKETLNKISDLCILMFPGKLILFGEPPDSDTSGHLVFIYDDPSSTKKVTIELISFLTFILWPKVIEELQTNFNLKNNAEDLIPSLFNKLLIKKNLLTGEALAKHILSFGLSATSASTIKPVTHSEKESTLPVKVSDTKFKITYEGSQLKIIKNDINTAPRKVQIEKKIENAAVYGKK